MKKLFGKTVCFVFIVLLAQQTHAIAADFVVLGIAKGSEGSPIERIKRARDEAVHRCVKEGGVAKVDLSSDLTTEEVVYSSDAVGSFQFFGIICSR